MRRPFYLTLFVLLLLSACRSGGDRPEIGTGGVGWRCTPLPDNFTTADLIGTWRKWGIATTDTDQLTLREDGTYQQILDKPDLGYYESSWNEWWIEQRPDGGTYLHLDGMRLCEYSDEICGLEEGGGGSQRYYDFCENRYLRMNEEVILSVIGEDAGPESGTLGGIQLMHMRDFADSSSNFFVLDERD